MGIFDRWLLVDDGEDADQARQTLLQRGVQRSEGAQRAGGDEQGGDEAGEITERMVADGGAPALEADDGGDRAAAQDLQHRVYPGAAFRHPQQGLVELGEGGLGAVGFLRLQAVGADGASLGETLVQQGGGLADAFLHSARGSADALADASNRYDGHRIHRGGDQRQQPIQVDHAGNQADHGDHVGNAIDGTGQSLPDRGGVGGEMGGELGGGLAFHAG